MVPSSLVTVDFSAVRASSLSPDGDIEEGRETSSQVEGFDMTALRIGSAVMNKHS